MRSLELNREYALRHLFVTVVFIGLGCWFGYDGFVRYPAADAAALYESIEGSAPQPGFDLAKFKAQKVASQRLFACFLLVLGAVVGIRLLRSSRFRFSWDDSGFSVGGERHSFGEVALCDSSLWKKKGILKLRLKPKGTVALDSWHHCGVRDFVAVLGEKTGIVA